MCGDFCTLAVKEVSPQSSRNCTMLSFPKHVLMPMDWLLRVVHVNAGEGLPLSLLWEVVCMVTLWIFGILVLFFFIFIHLYFCLRVAACLYVNHMHAVTAEANRGHQIPQNWRVISHCEPPSGKLGIKPQYSQRAETF